MNIYSLNPDAFGGDNSLTIPQFIERFSSVLYTGKGGYATFVKSLNITAAFPMRCFVGIPEDQFTPAWKVLVEAYCRHLCEMDAENIWVCNQPWLPTNPTRVPARLDKSVFDTDWACTLGLNQSQWANCVLMSSSALQRQVRLPNRENIFEQNVRLLLALAVYGFSDPMQFFTAS